MTKKQVQKFSQVEYKILADMIMSRGFSWHGSKKLGAADAIQWLWKGTWRRNDQKFLANPLSEMPLYLNDVSDRWRLIAAWRLVIAR